MHVTRVKCARNNISKGGTTARRELEKRYPGDGIHNDNNEMAGLRAIRPKKVIELIMIGYLDE